jgi:type I restriction enzyme S subunit
MIHTYKQTDVGMIPADWEVKLLGDVAVIRDGTHQTPKYVPSGVQFYSVENVTSGDFRNTKFISEQEHRFLTRSFKIEKGDILMTRIGSIGDCKLIDWDVDASFYVSLALLKIRQGHSAAYIAHYSKSASFQKEVELHSLQSAIPKKINLGPISNIRIVIPPLPEQRAIAAALSDVDALIGALEALIAKKRAIKQATMQQLLTGQTRLPGFATTTAMQQTEVGLIPADWEVKRLGEVGEIDPENLSNNYSLDFRFNYIALEDVDQGKLNGYTQHVFATAPSRARRKLRQKDILVATVRPNLKSHLLFNYSFGDYVCSTGFCVIRCSSYALPEYLYSHLFFTYVNLQIDTLLTGSNYPAINSRDVANIYIPFPPLAEQTAIASVLSDMDAELTALEAQSHKTRTIKQGMMQELLTGKTRLIVN